MAESIRNPLYCIILQAKESDVYAMAKKFNIEISVNGNVEKSLKQLKKKIAREGVVRDMKRQVYFEPNTQKRRKRLMRAIKNNYLKNQEENPTC